MSDKIFKLDKPFGELAASCVRGVRTKSEMEGRICTLLVDLQRYHQNYSKGLEARVKELEADLAKSHDDGYAMGWREALEIAQEKIMRIER